MDGLGINVGIGISIDISIGIGIGIGTGININMGIGMSIGDGILTTSGSIWHHLGCPAERSELRRLEIEPWPGNQALEAGNRETASIFVKLSTKVGFWCRKHKKTTCF